MNDDHGSMYAYRDENVKWNEFESAGQSAITA